MWLSPHSTSQASAKSAPQMWTLTAGGLLKQWQSEGEEKAQMYAYLSALREQLENNDKSSSEKDEGGSSSEEDEDEAAAPDRVCVALFY